MAKQAVRSPLGEGDLGDKPRLDPVRGLAGHLAPIERGPVALQQGQRGGQGLRDISRTPARSANAMQRWPSSFRSNIHAGSENLSLVSVASCGSIHAGTPPSRAASPEAFPLIADGDRVRGGHEAR